MYSDALPRPPKVNQGKVGTYRGNSFGVGVLDTGNREEVAGIQGGAGYRGFC